MYSFIYFCPPAGTSPPPYWSRAPWGHCEDTDEFQLMSVESKDAQYLPIVTGYKAQNPRLKVILSIGGWNFPSGYFSAMVATAASRAKFIASVKRWLTEKNADGIDLDWESPCSPARSDPVKITCEQFRSVADAGSKCPTDTANFALLLKELREGLGPTAYISVASQAAEKGMRDEDVKAASAYIDSWHIMSYDYQVSDLSGAAASMMSPNAPLYNPDPPALQMSINQTVHNYLAAGVPVEKITIGVPFYSHTWFAPGLISQGEAWKSFGHNGSQQGACCGPFKQTFGAQPGQGCGMCGLYMYSEILAAGGEHYFDEKTQSSIAFFPTAGKDSGYTAAGTWISYNEPRSVTAIVDYAKSLGVRGVFAFDSSQDTLSSNGQWNYTLMNLIADGLGGHGNATRPGPAPPSPPGPSPPGPPSPSHNVCAGKATGMYCVPGKNTSFVYCPQGAEESCAAKTCCKTTGPGAVICDWCK